MTRSCWALCALMLMACGGSSADEPIAASSGKASGYSGKVAAAACPMVRVGRPSAWDAFVESANARCAALKSSHFECEAQLKQYFEKCSGPTPTLEQIGNGLAIVEGIDAWAAFDGELSGAEFQSAMAEMQMPGFLYAVRSMMGTAPYQTARVVSRRPTSNTMEEIVELLFVSYPKSSEVYVVRFATIQEQNP